MPGAALVGEENQLHVGTLVDELQRLVGAYESPVDLISIGHGKLEGSVVGLFHFTSLNGGHGRRATPAAGICVADAARNEACTF